MDLVCPQGENLIPRYLHVTFLFKKGNCLFSILVEPRSSRHFFSLQRHLSDIVSALGSIYAKRLNSINMLGHLAFWHKGLNH